VWFDNPASLRLKYRVAVQQGLAGVGMWNLDCLDYSSDAEAWVQQRTREMWGAVIEELIPRPSAPAGTALLGDTVTARSL
jgi:di-N-acetylchitobiase